MEQKRPQRANRIRNLAKGGLNSLNLTQDGRDWMVLALDPFHDNQRTIAGFPDADSSGTVVSCFQFSADISKPAAAADTWDAHFFTSPLVNRQNVNLVRLTTLTAVDAVGTVAMSLVNCFTVDSGDPTLPSAFPFTVPESLALPASDVLANGISRVVGFGFEVVNTTPEIYKSGSVTAYRMPQPVLDDTNIVFCDNPITMSYPTNVKRARMPPSTADDAVKLLGSKTWKAADGAYVVASLSGVENPMLNTSFKGIVFHNNVDPAVVGAPGLAAAMAAPVVNGNPGVAHPVMAKYAPYNTGGAYFTGLSKETTLKLRVKVYVERAPTPAEVDLVPLATPSAGYDIMSLMLFAKAASILPVGVPVSENAAGDWFRRVLRAVVTLAPSLGLALAPVFPGAPKIAGFVQSAVKPIQEALGPEGAPQPQQRPKMKRTAGK